MVEVEDLRLVAMLRIRQGVFTRHLGDPEQARARLEDGLALYQAVGDARYTAVVFNNLGIVARLVRDYKEAQLLSQESLERFRQVSDHWGEALTLGNL